MNVQKKIEKWYRDERFARYMNERVNEEMRRAANQRLTPEYQVLDTGFDWDKRYIIPLTTYLTYRLQLAKLQKKARKRSRGIWWVFIRVIILGIYTEHFPREFEKLQQALLEEIMPMLHEEYLQSPNRNNQ